MKPITNPSIIAGTACLVVLAIGIIALQKYVGKLRNDELALESPQAVPDSPSMAPSVISPAPGEPAVAAKQNVTASENASGSGPRHEEARLPTNDQSRKVTNAKSSRAGSVARQPAIADLQADDRPVARQALSFVGADPDAENVWTQAINDPATSAHDRQDLIEDLNEDGFPDPHHVTADDLPLIESRIALIEQLAPDSMDDVNAAAFAEAYKDLINMHTQALGQ